uniref:Beta-defensin-like domain-containing protein n=1 Tax=Strix occidentalis caurina TaxID=311401 RepID=A0A8D0F9T6_STROC
MKILYLLFPFFLLLVQDAAGSAIGCRQRRGFCTFGKCRYPTTPIGRCSGFRTCCRR